MCITYFAFTVSTFFAPLIVGYLTAKWSMFLASTFYTTFMVTFMFVNSAAFYTTSALMGIGAARRFSFAFKTSLCAEVDGVCILATY
ncbi:unnamed protein product [Gongylonema pulchrum]|uniref:MFS domain-containing protein n=1 Tax=Gongylonema pulchrum TaxID=637853 RepID=A0A183DIA0_9BILA|nr:unnamed protein product [Gongylonema pulchrum]VDK62728.1 unnamed protein product [Gongylonema pulchrum]